MSAENGLRQEVIKEMETLPEDQLRDVLEFVESLRRESSSSPTSIEEKIEARLADVPDEALDELPEDASENLDHYLYGAPKK
jgi:vacuolar-type H+-ATPase subunit C/Vma6